LISRAKEPLGFVLRGISFNGTCSAFSFMESLRWIKAIGFAWALLIVPLISIPAQTSFSSEYDDILVLRSDQEGVVFRYLVPEPEMRKIDLGGESFDLMNIAKCGLSNIPGGFQLPVRRVIIAVPPEGEVSVEILDRKGEERSGINLAPAARAEPDGQNPVGYRTVPLRIKDSPTQRYPQQIISFDSPRWLRNQRVIELEITPIQYDPARRIVEYNSQITVGVRFRGGEVKQDINEKDLFERIYRSALLNYDQSIGWRKADDRPALRKPTIHYPFGYSDNWFKVVVRENGIYKIDRTTMIQSGVPVSSLDPKTIRIFSGGGKVLPLDNSNPFLELEEMAIFVSGEDDGAFDSEDFVLFFGWSPHDWDYDSSANATGFHTNPFTNDNVFWMTFNPTVSFPDAPRRMEVLDGSLHEENPITPVKFSSRIHIEADKAIRTNSSGDVVDYFNWYWMETSFARLFVNLPGLIPEDGCLIKIRHSQSFPSLRVNGESAEIIDTLSSLTLTVARSFDFIGAMVNTLEIQFSGEAGAFFDWYEVEYSRSFECYDRQLVCEGPDASGVTEIQIADLYSSVFDLFDITDYADVKKITGAQIDGSSARFQYINTSGSKKRYFLVDESRIKKPVQIFQDERSSLREASNRADFLIITHPDFYNQMQSLKSFRESYNDMSIKIIRVQDIYDEFSGGLFDPVAIRDFLKFAYQNWERPAPAYVLLVGDGHYDYRNNLGTDASNFIPPFAPNWEGDLSVSDDHFVYFGSYGYLDSEYLPLEGRPDMVIGRWPVRTQDEVEQVLNKVIGYEDQPEFGTWRNLITLVADDEFGKNSTSENIHTEDTEKLAKYHIPSGFNLSKIYLMEYPMDAKGEKPEAEEAIIGAFNSGTLVVNYLGHGNPDVWAHEFVFKRSQDIPRLNNKRKLPLVYTATCSIGLFFDPLREAMGEQFLTTGEKGSVATISATWLVFPQANAELNFKVFDLLLGQDSLSIGEALFIAKLLRQPNGNDRRFILFGDPITRLASPRLKAELTHVYPDTIAALSLARVEGEVRNDSGVIVSDFNGTVRILAYDSQRSKTHTMPGGEKVYYDLPGLIIFKGDAQVEGGSFQANFVVPKDISYGGNSGRISVYLEGLSQDGAGVRDSLVIAGSDTTVIDTVGPQITVSFDDRESFVDGETVSPNSILNMFIFDENGINITGEVGHGITLLVDRDFQKETELTERFQYDLGSYQRGSLAYQLPGLSDGDHDLVIKAWDNANNSSVKQLNLKVSRQAGLQITEVMNYPNPFSDVTNFYYRLSQDADQVEIKIFTQAGRLIRRMPGWDIISLPPGTEKTKRGTKSPMGFIYIRSLQKGR
jgi:hypothetical protein